MNSTDKYETSIKECSEDLNLDPGFVISYPTILSKTDIDPKQLSCIRKCVWEKMGYIDSKSNFIEAAFCEDHPEMPENHVHIIKKCIRPAGTTISTECSAFYNFDKCINDEIKKLRGVH